MATETVRPLADPAPCSIEDLLTGQREHIFRAMALLEGIAALAGDSSSTDIEYLVDFAKAEVDAVHQEADRYMIELAAQRVAGEAETCNG